jgi:hypothetical protein
MATFSDNLDGSVGDLLRLRSGWSRPVGADDISIVTGFTGGFAIPQGTTLASSTWHVPTSQPSSADQYVTALLDTTALATMFPMAVRADVSSNLGAAYMVRHGSTGQLQLFRRTGAGAQASIGTAAITAADLATNPVTLKAVGNQISVEFKGATVIGPVTDNTASSGSVAMLSRGGSTPTRSQINSWESGEVGGTPSPVDGTGSANAPALTLGAPVASASGAQTIAAVTGTIVATPPALMLGTPSANAGGAQTIAAVTGNGAATAPALMLGTPIAAGVGTQSEGGITGPTVRSLTFSVDPKNLIFSVDPKNLIFSVDPKNLTIYGLFDGVLNMKRLQNKTPDERWVVTGQISNWMGEDYTPVSASVTSETAGVTISGVALNDDELTFIIEEGSTPGEKLLRAQVTFAESDQVFTEDIKMTVVP